MAKNKIEFANLRLDAINVWINRCCLLTAGDRDNSNSMTIGWGSIGGMWSRPFVQVVVRPQRYTFEFMEKYDSFTVSVLPAQYKDALSIMGSKSGRDADKVSEAGLTLINSEFVDAPAFKEAELIFECRKNYWQDMNPDNFLDSIIFDKYPNKDYHRIYYGEIAGIFGEHYYRA